MRTLPPYLDLLQYLYLIDRIPAWSTNLSKRVIDRPKVLRFRFVKNGVIERDRVALIPHIRTLDAIHLASALRSGIDDLVITTHEATMKSVAVTLGLRTADPVE